MSPKLAALALLSVALSTLGAQAPGRETLTLDARDGGTKAELMWPARGRPPVLLLLPSDGDVSKLASDLAGRGIATVRYDAPVGGENGQIATAVAWIVRLRNDERFPLVAVLGRGDGVRIAAIATRIARADGMVSAAMPPRPSAAPAAPDPDLARLAMPAFHALANGSQADTAAIADFVRTLPEFGRRGARSERPAEARRSPRATVIATIGGSRIAIEYGQPQKRGREIWGGLVPWDDVWMPGADESTTLTTDVPITIGGLAVPAGDHTFYVWPTRTTASLIVSRDVGQFHTIYDGRKDLGRVPLTLAARTDVVEGLTFAIEPSGAGGVLKLIWDTREYSAPIAVK